MGARLDFPVPHYLLDNSTLASSSAKTESFTGSRSTVPQRKCCHACSSVARFLIKWMRSSASPVAWSCAGEPTPDRSNFSKSRFTMTVRLAA